MRTAIIGYGKIGRAIEALGMQQGHTFPLVIDLDNSGDLVAANMKEIDVAIEFTGPQSAPENIRKCIEMGVPVVSGSTGWNHRFAEIEHFCLEHNGALFYASNFSIGVNILFAMNRQLARIMNRFPDYSVSMEEVHHIHKLDAPSGTAITLSEQIIEEQDRVNSWSLIKQDDPSVLHINAIREGEVKGRHTITHESNLDTIYLGHNAKSRDAFAVGALMAAAFIKDKVGIFSMNDMLRI
ncbi:MAG: 4-hydroxy-tetrahydrodipicolinate reductase [Bacteroidota bacterium]